MHTLHHLHDHHLCVRTFSSIFSDQKQNSISNSLSCSSSTSFFSLQLHFRTRRWRVIKSLHVVSCNSSNNSSNWNFGRRPNNGDDHDDRYIEAVVLYSETLRHYHLRRRGFLEETKWSGQLFPFSSQAKDPKTDLSSIGHGFLRRFQNSTIFLKIDCDGDLLLPVTVGEFAVENLIDGDALRDGENWDLPNQFQLVKNLVEKLGYEVKMVRITERVINTYYARIYFAKPGDDVILSIDARPSDAINVAKRCKVAIYVNKQIVLTDAIKIVYGTRRVGNAKSVYDVSLDSAAEGRDVLGEELDLLRNMHMAVREERYKDAAILRDKLAQLRTSTHEL